MRTTTLNAVLPAARKGRARRSLFAAVAAAGVALVSSACSEGYDVPIPANYQPPQGDVDCMADEEPSQGDVCTKDCLTATCAGGLGRRICTCEGGVFLQCACLPPPNWPYDHVPAAPFCDRITGQPRNLALESCQGDITCQSEDFPGTGCRCVMGKWQCSEGNIEPGQKSCEEYGSGLYAVLDDGLCDQEWQLCIARNYNPEGTSPRGCVCMKAGAQLQWTCGATNRWYRAE